MIFMFAWVYLGLCQIFIHNFPWIGQEYVTVCRENKIKNKINFPDD